MSPDQKSYPEDAKSHRGIDYHANPYRDYREKTKPPSTGVHLHHDPYVSPLGRSVKDFVSKLPPRDEVGRWQLGTKRVDSFTCVQCDTYNLDVEGTVVNSNLTKRGWIMILSDHECAFCHRLNRQSHTELAK